MANRSTPAYTQGQTDEKALKDRCEAKASRCHYKFVIR